MLNYANNKPGIKACLHWCTVSQQLSINSCGFGPSEIKDSSSNNFKIAEFFLIIKRTPGSFNALCKMITRNTTMIGSWTLSEFQEN